MRGPYFQGLIKVFLCKFCANKRKGFSVLAETLVFVAPPSGLEPETL